jgi:DNA-directed RNA polymerase specialized sigma24 family protein
MVKLGSNGRWQTREANIEEHYARKEAENDLKRAIHRLRPVLRTIIEIQQSHDGSVKEIAGTAGISVAAVKSRLSRARTVLRRTLQSSVRSSTPRRRGNFRDEDEIQIPVVQRVFDDNLS